MKRIAGAGIIFAAVLLLMPLATFAQSKPSFLIKPIVPVECRCDNQKNASDGTILTTAPDFGCVMQVVQNSINHGVSIAAILFVIFIVIAGFAFVTARDSSEALSQAKTRITNVFIGLAVLLLAWLLVDYVMKTLYRSDGKSFGPWNTILAQKFDGSDRCIVAKNSTSLASGTVTSGSLTSDGTNPAGLATVGAGANANARICSATANYIGTNTSAGPSNGKLACAWAVNNILTNAGYRKIGSDAVSTMESALKGGRGAAISQSQADCGDIVIEAGDSHVGICLNAGCTRVISNSSSKASFSWPSSINFQPSYHSGNGRIYRVTN